MWLKIKCCCWTPSVYRLPSLRFSRATKEWPRFVNIRECVGWLQLYATVPPIAVLADGGRRCIKNVYSEIWANLLAASIWIMNNCSVLDAGSWRSHSKIHQQILWDKQRVHREWIELLGWVDNPFHIHQLPMFSISPLTLVDSPPPLWLWSALMRFVPFPAIFA